MKLKERFKANRWHRQQQLRREVYELVMTSLSHEEKYAVAKFLKTLESKGYQVVVEDRR